MSAHERQVLFETDLAAVFREMEGGNYLEPSDDEFERAMQGRSQSYSSE